MKTFVRQFNAYQNPKIDEQINEYAERTNMDVQSITYVGESSCVLVVFVKRIEYHG